MKEQALENLFYIGKYYYIVIYRDLPKKKEHYRNEKKLFLTNLKVFMVSSLKYQT
jgi:hypothetical protein